MTALKEQGLVSRGCADVLERISGAPSQILEKTLNNKSANNEACPEELKAFAMTLQFFSTKAYSCLQNIQTGAAASVGDTVVVQLRSRLGRVHTVCILSTRAQSGSGRTHGQKGDGWYCAG